MKKIVLLFLFSLLLFADDVSIDLNITGSRVSYECNATTQEQTFSYYTWAEGCPATSRASAYAFLLGQNYFQESLPECLPPTNPNPPLGETLSQDVPEGYELIDENITSSSESYYDGYGFSSSSPDATPRVSGIKTNAFVVRGFCQGLSLGITFGADVYNGILKEESFIQYYHRTCDENDTTFPPKADNQIVADEWSSEDLNRSQRCLDYDFTLQKRKESCENEYRCLAPSYCKVEQDEEVSSYISPSNRSFHEDIPLTGTAYSLHYSSASIDEDKTNIDIAYGWSLSSYASLRDERVYLGSGSIIAISDANSYQEDDYTVVTLGSSELLFDTDGSITQKRKTYTKETISTYSYAIDSSGIKRLESITNAYGETTYIQRDGDGKAIAISSPYKQRTLLTIDDNNNLTQLEYANSSVSYTFEYDDKHLMTKEIEPNGNEFLHIFDDSSRVTEVIDAIGAKWSFDKESDDNFYTNTITKPEGDILTYKNYYLDNSTLKVEKILPSGETIEYNRDIDDTTQTTTSCNQQTTTRYKRDTDNKLYIDPHTKKRVLEQKTITTPSGKALTTNYTKEYINYRKSSDIKKIITTATTNSNISQTITNFNTHKINTITPMGKRSTIKFDNQMRLALSINPYGLRVTSYEYNNKGRVTKEQIGNRATSYEYDSKNNLISTTNPKGETTTYSYDDLNRLITVTYPNSNTINYSYDNNGNMITLVTPTPTDHTFAYNGVNKNTSYTSPLQKATHYEYDKQRRVTKVTKPSNKAIEYTYTGGKLSQLSTAEGNTDYDYSCLSNLASITKGSESLNLTYDGSLLTALDYDGVVDQTISYTYNDNLQVDSITYANQTQEINYNPDSQPTAIGNYTIQRDNKDRVTTITDTTNPSYSKTTTSNRYSELRSIIDNTLSVKLTRDKAGQITKKVEQLQNNKKKIYKYSYDDIGRLIEVKLRNKTIEEYSYDKNGNRLQAIIKDTTTNTTTTTTASYTLDDQLQVYGDNTYRYDDDGYLIEKVTPDGTTSYDYGTMGELLEVQTPTQTITYLHNANNQRVAKLIDNQVVEKYLWLNLTTLLAVYDRDDNLVQRYEYANSRMPIAMTTSDNTKYYLHYDQVGTLRAVSDTNHKSIKEITYDTFGNILSDTNPDFKVPFGFAGGLYDTDTKLTRFGYREYDAYTGKWTAKDPIGFGGGDANLYGYVLGDPVGLVDPSGENPFAILLLLMLFDSYLNAPNYGENPLSGITPEAQFGLLCIGGTAGWASAGAKGRGLEFSHWIPNRMGGSRTKWNGNYVPKNTHALSDPYRYRFMPRTWKTKNAPYNAFKKHWTRLPNVYKGLGASAEYGAASNTSQGCSSCE